VRNDVDHQAYAQRRFRAYVVTGENDSLPTEDSRRAGASRRSSPCVFQAPEDPVRSDRHVAVQGILKAATQA
jgi:hypothetical protein